MKKSIKMKKIILTILLIAFVSITQAQTWLTDINQAKQRAKEQNKKIVLVFQGSDWCTPCIKLDHEIWQSDDFKKYAKEHFVMVKADFPRKKKNRLTKEQQAKNNKLAEKYNKNGIFPLVVILDASGKVLNKMSFEAVSPKEYIKKMEAE